MYEDERRYQIPIEDRGRFKVGSVHNLPTVDGLSAAQVVHEIVETEGALEVRTWAASQANIEKARIKAEPKT